MQCMFDGTRGGFARFARGDHSFIQSQINIGERDVLGLSCQTPSTGVTFFRGQQTCLPQLSQDPAYNDRVGARMLCDVARRAHTIRVAGHMAEGVQSE